MRSSSVAAVIAALAGCGGNASPPAPDRGDSAPAADAPPRPANDIAPSNSPPAATGKVDKATLRRSIQRHAQAIELCYEKELRGVPDHAGQLLVEFDLGSDGKAHDVEAPGMATPVRDCIASVIGAIELPKPTGGSVHVRYPIWFGAAGE